ncbi:MAG: hypothetical protein HQ543_10610 [Bacteroidetes bacterium]|nr:hypothetical protein [Bacteroidota bacterium]
MKKKILLIFLVSVMANLILSCDEKFSFLEVDCSECYRIKPDNGELIIQVTINNENPEVPIAIYRDKIESGRIRIKDTISDQTVYIEVPLNHYYSVQAKYKAGNDSVFAVDGERIETHRVTDQCDTTCWIIKGGRYDLRLKEKTP